MGCDGNYVSWKHANRIPGNFIKAAEYVKILTLLSTLSERCKAFSPTIWYSTAKEERGELLKLF